MNTTKSFRTACAAGVLGACVVAASSAGAASIDVPIQGLDGTLQLNGAGGLSVDGISETGNLLLQDLAFTIPDVSSTGFNALLTGGSPVQATLTIDGSAQGQSATLSVTDTFTDLTGLAKFFTPAATQNDVILFGSGSVSGAFSTGISNIAVNATDRGFGESAGSGANQLTSGKANLVATADDIPASLDDQSFEVTGNGTLSLEQVAVPAPAFASIVGLTLLGIGLFWRRKERARGTRIDTDENVVC